MWRDISTWVDTLEVQQKVLVVNLVQLQVQLHLQIGVGMSEPKEDEVGNEFINGYGRKYFFPNFV